MVSLVNKALFFVVLWLILIVCCKFQQIFQIHPADEGFASCGVGLIFLLSKSSSNVEVVCDVIVFFKFHVALYISQFLSFAGHCKLLFKRSYGFLNRLYFDLKPKWLQCTAKPIKMPCGVMALSGTRRRDCVSSFSLRSYMGSSCT